MIVPLENLAGMMNNSQFTVIIKIARDTEIKRERRSGGLPFYEHQERITYRPRLLEVNRHSLKSSHR